MLPPSHVTPGLQPTAQITKPFGDNRSAKSAVPWADLRSRKITAILKQFRPLVLLVRYFLYCAGIFVRPYVVSMYMKANSVRKLQIGADVWMLSGWLNTDLCPKVAGCVTLDATKPFPLASASFDYVFSEHQMEHIQYSDAVRMLRECHRVLRPGGKLRIAVPSLDPLIELFAPSRTELQEQYIASRTGQCYPNAPSANPCYATNATFMNWGHRFLYDRETLQSLLQEIGYKDIKFFEPGKSDDVNLIGLEVRTSDLDRYETMVVQAVRP